MCIRDRLNDDICRYFDIVPFAKEEFYRLLCADACSLCASMIHRQVSVCVVRTCLVNSTLLYMCTCIVPESAILAYSSFIYTLGESSISESRDAWADVSTQ